MPNCWYLGIQVHYIEYCMQYWRLFIDVFKIEVCHLRYSISKVPCMDSTLHALITAAGLTLRQRIGLWPWCSLASRRTARSSTARSLMLNCCMRHHESIFDIKAWGPLHGQYLAITFDVWLNDDINCLTVDFRIQYLTSSMPNCWYLGIQVHYIEYCMQYWRLFQVIDVFKIEVCQLRYSISKVPCVAGRSRLPVGGPCSVELVRTSELPVRHHP